MVEYSTVLQIIFAVLLPNIGGFVNGFLTKGQIETWYKTITLPTWRPPNWVFGPVWTFLYCSMGYASYLVWRDGNGFGGEALLPLIMYGIQLALNWAWTTIFFVKHELKWVCNKNDEIHAMMRNN